MKHQTGNCA